MRLRGRTATVLGGVLGILVAVLLGAGGGAVATAGPPVPVVGPSSGEEDDGPCGVTYGEHAQRPPEDCEGPVPEIPGI
ncbi:hypothetical protein [Paractinoplanes rishiriensis]|nr:hypothetical protein [Actinoplanes rishiriensis]